MASKQKRNRDDFKEQDVLQAVVIADSFNVRFAPISLQKPRALLPLVNLPLIDYTLECLCNGGIQQAFVFCCCHSDQIKQHIQSSKWNGSRSSMEVEIIISESCMSIGDALRDIDAKSLLSTDFVLVNGDLIANVNLAPIVQMHKTRRLKEKSPIMTMLFKKAPPGHPTRCDEEEVVLAVEKQTNRIISYQKVNQKSRFQFPLEMFTGKTDIELRYDLLDCQISICSPLVPTLFTDNFDYLSREHFVKGILVNEEILGNTIHMHLLTDEYAARVSNLHMYESVSRDVLSRWSYPLVPDKNLTDRDDDRHTHGRHNIYLHNDVTLARGCVLEENVIIGKGSCVGCDSKIANSVIGKNVKIGDNVVMNGAYIWDNCDISNSCKLDRCLLDTGVHLAEKVHIKPGCVLSRNVRIGAEMTLCDATLWTSEPVADEFEGNKAEFEPAVVGKEGVAYRYEQECESDDEAHDQVTWGVEHVTDDDDQSDDSLSSDDDSRENSPLPDDSKLFYDEVVSTLERAIVENINIDNLILEINSAKSAYGIYINEVNVLLTKAILQLPFTQRRNHEGDKPPPSYMTQLQTNFKRLLLPLLQNYIRSKESQIDCIYSIEDSCLLFGEVRTNLVKLLHYLYNKDVLSEEVVVMWHKTIRSEEFTEERKDCRTVTKSFISWLEEAEEESDDE